MTKAVQRNNSHKDDNFSGISSHLRDENDAIGEQLGSHVHLTNCIHLRNHIHLHSPNMTERSLIRDLIVLQQSRSLRDPSTSPPSWISPSIVGSFAKRTVNDCSVHTERRSVGIDRRNEVSQLSASSTAVGSTAKSKSPTIEDVMRNYDIGQRGRAADKSRNEEANAKCPEVVMPESKIQYKDSSGSLHGKEKKLGKSVHVQAARLRTLSEQLEEVTNQLDYGCKKPSPLSHHDRPVGEPHQWPKENINENFNGKNRTKKCRVKNARRSRGSIDLRGTHTRRSLAAASDLMAQVSDVQDYTGNCQENTEVDAAWAPINVCGIPWNWSRIHHRGKTYLDKAGRSFSCSMSESGPRETEVPIPQREDNTLSMGPGVSNKLTPSTSSDSEVLPLLNEASGSRESDVNHFLSWDYSGEFGVFTNRSLMDGIDSDHVSDERSHNHRKYRGCDHGRHRSLTQKYMPKTFKDLVGQNLVVQALTNAVSRNIVGLIYIFYGPHGTGKTSCARVFTKALNCQSAEHLRPCDICNSCISHNLGRSKDVIEVGPVGKFDFERIIDAFENLISPPRSSQYKVFIIDDCDTLPQNLWGPISKVIDKAPRHVIFVLISSNLDHFPHIILSRCQKFFFPKLKDSDILRTLQWISTSEGLEIDRDALKLIASRSDGSLRDAEMTLDQLCLLGQGVSLSLVQELVGLVSDEKLVDLLDLALSADTVNTVKSLREIMETGVEPLALMSQIATVITDILAGSYVFTQERLRRKFFRRITLSKAEMEKLRQALKTLSHAEKQLRVSNDKLTWLTAALLQLAPDQQYVLPNSSTDRSFSHSPIILSNNARGVPKSPTSEQDDMHIDNKELPGGFGVGIRNSKSRNYALNSVPMGQQLANSHIVNKGYCEHVPHKLVLSKETVTKSEGYNDERSQKNIGKIWQAVLENIQSDALRQFLYSEGKLHSINLGAAPTARLVFSSNANKSRAENFRVQILQAFESVIGSATILEIRSESRTNFGNGVHASPVLPASENITFMMTKQQSISGKGFIHSDSQNLQRIGRRDARLLYSVPHIITEGEIIEMGTSREEYKQMDPTNKNITPMEKVLESAWTAETSSSQHQHKTFPFSERKDGDNQHQRKSLIRGKISLAHVIQQAESCSKLSGWSRLKAISITEKLERENLRLEPRSRSLLCWKASKRTRTKLSSLRIGSRKPRALMKLVACGRCLYVRSPR